MSHAWKKLGLLALIFLMWMLISPKKFTGSQKPDSPRPPENESK